MKNRQANKKRETAYLVILFLVIGLTAFSNAMKDLNQVRAVTAQVGDLVAVLTDALIPSANARTPYVAPQTNDEFTWNGIVAPGQSIEIKGLNGDINAEAASGSEVQVVAVKKARRSDVNLVQIKVVQHPRGVTICALYPDADGSVGTCEPGDAESRSSSTRNTVHKNDVSVNFRVKVPAGVAFVGKTVNGEITATSLASNVSTRTVNGSIKISTSGYADAKTVNGEISAKLGDANWTSGLAFSTVNGEINLELPANTNADVEAQTLNGAIVTDFPLSTTDMKIGKHVKGRIGSGGRELQLKTLNGSINLRLAS